MSFGATNDSLVSDALSGAGRSSPSAIKYNKCGGKKRRSNRRSRKHRRSRKKRRSRKQKGGCGCSKMIGGKKRKTRRRSRKRLHKGGDLNDSTQNLLKRVHRMQDTAKKQANYKKGLEEWNNSSIEDKRAAFKKMGNASRNVLGEITVGGKKRKSRRSRRRRSRKQRGGYSQYGNNVANTPSHSSPDTRGPMPWATGPVSFRRRNNC